MCWTKQPGTDRLLMLVDQWEELYTLCRDESLRRNFISQLLSATQQDHLSTVGVLVICALATPE